LQQNWRLQQYFRLNFLWKFKLNFFWHFF